MSTDNSEQALIERVSKSETAVRQVIQHLPIEALLKVRATMKDIHAKQLAAIDEILTAKGYVAPHLEGTLNHGRE